MRKLGDCQCVIVWHVLVLVNQKGKAMIGTLCLAISAFTAEGPQATDASSPPRVDDYLCEGRLEPAATALVAHLEANPSDADVHWMMGYTHLLRAITKA